MKKLARYYNKKVGILGFGKSGKAAMQFLLNSGAIIYIYDDTIIKPKNLKNISWEKYENWDWKNLFCLVISPGIQIFGTKKHKCIKLARKNNIPIVNEIHFLMEQNPSAKIIGVTGTNGKSTLVSLISHILKKNKINNFIGGNFGNPACLINDPGNKGVIILELSSFQLLSIPNLSLDYATITNISPDHIDYHETFEAYINSKLKIIQFLKKNGSIIINNEDIFLKKIVKVFEKDKKIEFISKINRNKLNNSNLNGYHNLINCSLAIKLCELLNVKKINIYDAINSFVNLPHRMEKVFSSKEILIINDSKATNGESAAAALSSYKNIFWIAGGISKEDGIGNAINKMQEVKHIILIGKSKQKFKKQITNKNFKIPISESKNLTNAIDIIFEKISKFKNEKKTILFSPAASSFDEFKNFEDRGNQFKKIIKTKLQSEDLIC